MPTADQLGADPIQDQNRIGPERQDPGAKPRILLTGMGRKFEGPDKPTFCGFCGHVAGDDPRHLRAWGHDEIDPHFLAALSDEQRRWVADVLDEVEQSRGRP